ncbi:uncharacterized protein LOC125456037 isoform X2 [Stegostoma tigrinum]|uniref:uncharacterized protein LOC125456037 isoform X2 n=1 Tax=Stegostoma tigrinum TaxID=3053191 RepID=UPI00202B7631|nr:uncharacterized protein LOC125456037 isoform X2 [Stegostoma tigrinum]
MVDRRQAAAKSKNYSKPSSFLTKWKKNGEELKGNVNMGDTCAPTVTMETREDILEHKTTCVSNSVVMEIEGTENGTFHQETITVTAEREHAGLNYHQQMLKPCALTEPALLASVKEASGENQNNNASGIELSFQMDSLDQTEQVPLVFGSMSSSYEMPEAIYAIIHKDHFKDSLTNVLSTATAQSLEEDLEVTCQGIASEPFTLTTAAAVVDEFNQEATVRAFQTTSETENESATSAVTGPKGYLTANLSITNENEKIEETILEGGGNKEIVEPFSTTGQGMNGLSATHPIGFITFYSISNGNKTSNRSITYHRDSECLPNDTAVQYVEELETAGTEKFKFINKHSNYFIYESQSNGSAPSRSKNLAFKEMETEDRSLSSKTNQNDEVKVKPNNTKFQSAEQNQEQNSQTEASGNENVDTEHMDFATARRQWLLLEEISKMQNHRPLVKSQKTKSLIKRIFKDNTDGPSVMELTNKVTAHADSASFSGDKVQSSTSEAIKMHEVESWRDLTNLHNKVGIAALQENKGGVENLGQNLFLNIADFSACSEDSDSGLDDSTSRSESDNLTDTIFQNEASSSVSATNGKAETPIEREIRLGVKREESLRKARGIKKHPGSEEYVEIKTRPLIFQPVPSPLAKAKINQFAEMQMQREILLERQREEDLVQQGKVKGTYDQSLIPEIEERRKFFEQHYPFPLPINSKMFNLHITPAPSTMKKCSFNNEVNFDNNRLENSLFNSSKEEKTGVGDEILKFKYPTAETSNVVILETSDVVLRRSSHFSLSSISSPLSEDLLQKNPFFKLRSNGSESILNQEIKEVLQREEELRKQRCFLHGMENSSESSLPSSAITGNLSPGFLYRTPILNAAQAVPATVEVSLGKHMEIAS